MTDRAIRNLAHLRRSASSARVLNLLKVIEDSAGEPDWQAFASSLLSTLSVDPRINN